MNLCSLPMEYSLKQTCWYQSTELVVSFVIKQMDLTHKEMGFKRRERTSSIVKYIGTMDFSIQFKII